MDDTKFLQGLRHLCLSFVDLLERRLGISPRTAEIRKWYKADHRQREDLNGESIGVKREPASAD
jgi:hypothetical protein